MDGEAAGSEATETARRVAGAGGLAGLRRLTETISAMETARAQIIDELRRSPGASWEEIGRACGMTRQGATRRWSRLVQASSFGQAADAYQRGRPEYPESAIEWLVPRRARHVLDLGAGTGKLTRLLADAGLRVTAVEPSEQMREQLVSAVPEARVLAGSAEEIPLEDGAVDAVVVGHAWHWFDPGRAVPEIARVLAKGGTLALAWNVREETVPWAAALGRIMHQHSEQVMDTRPDIGEPFGPPERMEIRWNRAMTRAEILDLVASRSYVITLPATERTELLGDVEEFLNDHPDVKGRDEIALPYITRCTRVRRR
jgi:SAM-dependent methyltransferase